jgi:hypothetical protein
MKTIDLGKALGILANLGVIAGIVFLGLEIRQNTAALDREIAISSAETVFGKVAESDYLPEIFEKVMAIQGPDAVIPPLMAEFGLSNQEAQRLWRYMTQVWIHDQADWIYNGRSKEDCFLGKILLTFRDNQIWFSYQKDFLDPEYVVCLESSDESE